MTIRTLALASAATSIQDHRLALGAFMGPGSSVLERRGGVQYYPGAADLVSASSLQANVTPFLAIVDGTSNALQGQIPVVVDANVTLTFSAGEVAVARTDRVVLQVRDNTYDASGSTDARVLIVKGNTSTGAANSVPASSLLLWEVVVPIGASSITFASARVDRRQWTATPLRIPVGSSTDRDALPAITGLEALRLDTGDIQQYWSGAWRTIAPGATPTRFLVANQAARDALTPYSGLEVTRLDTGDVEQYWSGAWRTIAPSVTTQPRARVTKSTQSITNLSETTLSFTAAAYNASSIWSAGAPTRLTVPSGMGGLWHVGGVGQWVAATGGTGAGQQYVKIYKNAGTQIGYTDFGYSSAYPASQLGQTLSADYEMAAGDYFTMTAFTGRGSAADFQNIAFWAHRVSA